MKIVQSLLIKPILTNQIASLFFFNCIEHTWHWHESYQIKISDVNQKVTCEEFQS